MTNNEDQRPPVWVGHVLLETDRMQESNRFLRAIGMRAIHEGAEVSVWELRGGTHLIVLAREQMAGGDAKFDLMVEDLHATHRDFTARGFSPTPIEALPAIDHECFRVREPAGHWITFYSSHVSGVV